MSNYNIKKEVKKHKEKKNFFKFFINKLIINNNKKDRLNYRIPHSHVGDKFSTISLILWGADMTKFPISIVI